MPFTIRKVRGRPCYTVRKKKQGTQGKRVFSKCATKENAKKQLQLLRAITYNPNFTKRAKTQKKHYPV